jgi:hypothetical protein
MCESELDISKCCERDYARVSNCDKCSMKADRINKHICNVNGRNRGGFMCNVISRNSLMKLCAYLCIIVLLDHGLVRLTSAQGNV